MARRRVELPTSEAQWRERLGDDLWERVRRSIRDCVAILPPSDREAVDFRQQHRDPDGKNGHFDAACRPLLET